MKRGISLTIVVCLLTAAFVINTQAQTRNDAQQARREVAITFDDLPVVSLRRDIGAWREMTARLLRTVTSNRIPAIGFVNENKLFINDVRDDERVAVLRMWANAGLELGNHTFSHPSLNRTPLAEFQANVIRGEEVTSELMRAGGRRLRYFRHPFLHTGRSLEVKREFEEFLAGRGYIVAPVTIDNSDWIFARAYDNAFARNDRQMMRRIARAYVPYMESKFAYFERQSRALFGREIRHVLLLHANAINADYFDELVSMMRRRGYTFITLGRALADDAYRSADTFTGEGGISWMDRWALTRGVPGDFFRSEPRTPEFVMREAGVMRE